MNGLLANCEEVGLDSERYERAGLWNPKLITDVPATAVCLTSLLATNVGISTCIMGSGSFAECISCKPLAK